MSKTSGVLVMLAVACVDTTPNNTGASTALTAQSTEVSSRMVNKEVSSGSRLSKSNLNQALREGTIDFRHTKNCQIVDSQDENAPNGWFVYAWNESGTVGLVVSIHRFSPADIRVGERQTLDLEQRDAFVMIESGQGVQRNFCVRTIQEIPMVTVLESQGGTVQLSRTESGLSVDVLEVSLKDQYSGVTVNLAPLSVQTGALEQSHQ